VQIVPRHDIFSNPHEMRNIQTADLWMERNSCYSFIMRKLLPRDPGFDSDNDEEDTDPHHQGGPRSHWRQLREFESGDAADREAWEMAVQYVAMSGANWHVERDGVFVRGPDPAASEPGTAATSAGIGAEDSSSSDQEDWDEAAEAHDILSVSPDSFSPW
jgi:hypothetical protein